MSEQSSPSVARGRPKDPAKRLAILNAAKQLFLSQGFASTSMDAVAAEAGVSKLTVYSHFSDKDSLFSAAVAAECESQMPMPMFDLELGSSAADVLQRIGEAFLTMLDSPDSIRLLRLMCAVGGKDQKMAQLFNQAGPSRTLVEMERFLRRATELGMLQVEDPAIAAEYFFGMLQGGCRHIQVLIGCAAAPTAQENRTRVAEAVRIFMRAYG